MFNGLAAYIFGGRLPVTNEENDDDGDEKVLNGDDDWILVDEEENKENYSDLELLTMPSSRASSCSSSPLIADWNLTPPSCFERSNSEINKTSSDANQTSSSSSSSTLGTDLEISIFENLLIEHPSVSVYYRYGTRRLVSQLNVKSSSSVVDDVSNDDVVVVDDDYEQELRSATSVISNRCKNSTHSLDQCLWNKTIGLPLSIVEQQRLTTVENGRKLNSNRLRRQNLLVRHQTFRKSVKKLRQLQ